MSVQNHHFTGFLLSGNGINFLYVEVSTAWLHECFIFFTPLFKADRCSDRIPIHFQDTFMSVDPITRQSYHYATTITCDNSPRNKSEFDPDLDDQNFYILKPEPMVNRHSCVHHLKVKLQYVQIHSQHKMLLYATLQYMTIFRTEFSFQNSRILFYKNYEKLSAIPSFLPIHQIIMHTFLMTIIICIVHYVFNYMITSLI